VVNRASHELLYYCSPTLLQTYRQRHLREELGRLVMNGASDELLLYMLVRVVVRACVCVCVCGKALSL
jgi:hypothetical protein